MKQISIFLIILTIAGMSAITAKAADNKFERAFLFPQFEEGYVASKNNNTHLPALLNYDMIQECVLYYGEDSILYRLDAAIVAYVVIGGRIFLPSGNKFYYERVAVGGNEYYVRNKVKISSKGVSSGYGTYSETSSASTQSFLGRDNKIYSLEVDAKFDRTDESFVYILEGKSFRRIYSLKSVTKNFKSHQAVIESFAKEQKINFALVDDIKSIVAYALSL